VSAVQEPRGSLDVLVVADAAAMRAAGRALASVLRPGDLVLLSGPLGAGKTTFAQGVGDGLGVRGPVTSPTFVISRVHPSLSGGPALVHVDAYRVGAALEVDDLDLDASVDTSVTLVEWGDGKVEGLAPAYLVVALERSDETEVRTLTVSGYGPRWEGAPADEARTLLRAAVP
jgi:tRNA threonylcarbamoyladenosine biosynthesis protein TsaE